MDHLLVKAATTATTDQGEFSAIAAAYTIDRVKDRIIPGAFKATIQRWQASGKRIPLHWNHEGDPRSIIGSIDPASMKETQQGLYVEGRLDIKDSDMAREAWRSMKNGAMSLSFGYIVEKNRKARDGVNDLLAIDLFEISIVPAPANADTRVLSLKNADELHALADAITTGDELLGTTRKQAVQAFADAISGQTENQELQQDVEAAGTPPEGAPETPDTAKAAATDQEPQVPSVDPLRTHARKLALEIRSDGLSVQPPPQPVAVQTPKPRPQYTPGDLRKHSRDLLLQVLSGIETEEP